MADERVKKMWAFFYKYKRIVSQIVFKGKLNTCLRAATLRHFVSQSISVVLIFHHYYHMHSYYYNQSFYRLAGIFFC